MIKQDTKKQKVVQRKFLADRITSNVESLRDGLLRLEEAFKEVGFHDASHSVSRYRVLASVIQADVALYREVDK